MSDRAMSRTRSAAQLREAFDSAFAHPIDGAGEAQEDLLLISLDGQAHVLRLADVIGLHPLTGLTTLPTAVQALLGVASIRGEVRPVYDLRRITGGASTSKVQWCVLAKHLPVALAFDSFEGHLRCPSDALLDGWCITPQGNWPLLNLASVLDWIQQASAHDDNRQEL